MGHRICRAELVTRSVDSALVLPWRRRSSMQRNIKEVSCHASCGGWSPDDATYHICAGDVRCISVFLSIYRMKCNSGVWWDWVPGVE